MWICGGLTPCGPSALLATTKASFEKKRHAVWQSPLSWNEKCGPLKVNQFFVPFMGQKVVFWSKQTAFCQNKRRFGVFWTKFEVADLKQRQRATAMDRRNKIQSVVLPTDDPGNAPDCIPEYGLCTCEYGRIHVTYSADQFNIRVSPAAQAASS